MLLDMHGICKDYMQGKMNVPVLKDVSLQVEEGDYLAIMGPSGSGKTTLMNLIGCLDVPTRGSYFLDGEEIGKLSHNRLAEVRNETLGFVFQSFYLLPKMSALDNVALPLLYAGVSKKERRARAKEALERMGLGDRVTFRPNQLSGGQCQRVAIARAIVTNPKILLADEPTGALDSASGTQIMDIFDELNQSGVTIIMITHEQEVAARANRICHIRDGILSGGMPEYEPQGASRKVAWDEATMELPRFCEEEPATEPMAEQFIQEPTEEWEAPIPQMLPTQSLTEEQLQEEELPTALPAEESASEPQDSILDSLGGGRGLHGHDTDLFEMAYDVFDSPDRPDVFASPEIGDVFSVTEGEEFRDHV